MPVAFGDVEGVAFFIIVRGFGDGFVEAAKELAGRGAKPAEKESGNCWCSHDVCV